MCGIIGFNWNDKKLVKNLNNLLSHRGPDDSGVYSDDHISLGHRRLSILDLSKQGKQPMTNKSENLLIVFNGEIFNFKELRDDLISKGYVFESDTDTEVLLKGYEEFGKKILNIVNGQFAFAIYDKKKSELFLARDRIGINPLYYYWDKEKFIFGSEFKTILRSGVDLQINSFAKNHYLIFGHTPRKQSIIENAFKLEPGHYLIFNIGESRISAYKRYWSFEFMNEITDEAQAIKQIRTLLDESVKMRLVSDVPVGAFLSGGVDSSAVVAYMSKYTDNLNTFSVSFDYDDFDESKYSMKVSELFKTNHHIIKFSALDIKKLIPKLIFYYDEPIGDPSIIPMYLVSQVAKKHVTVSLSGDGGDELFAGYNSHKHYRKLQATKYYPQIINDVTYEFVKHAPVHSYVKSYFDIARKPKQEHYARVMSFLKTDEAKKITGQVNSSVYKYYQLSEKNWLRTAMRTDMNNYLPEDILTKVDRASLANSLESRPPLLDHRFVELAANIHPHLKLKGKEGKYIFKKALEGTLPNEILYRKKQGFGVPLKHYFNNELKEFVEEVKNMNFTKYGLKEINFDTINNKHLLIWRYFMYKRWFDEWIDVKLDKNI